MTVNGLLDEYRLHADREGEDSAKHLLQDIAERLGALTGTKVDL